MISRFLIITFLYILSYNTTSSESIPLVPTADPTAEIYKDLAQNAVEIPARNVFTMAMNGWNKLKDNFKSPIITVIDFSLPSTEKRLWIIDTSKGEVLLNSVVSHGRNSGQLMAESFSNQPESFKSSLGFYQTGETYSGKHGYSLRLDGLEEGFNDQARNRAIVIHGADYAREEFAKGTGRLGRSLGCPALPSEISAEAIDLIKGGTLLFIYGQDKNYLSNSSFLHS